MATSSAALVLVAVATYKERDNLGPLVQEVHQVVPTCEILITDDNSPDGTGQLADELASADKRIRVLHRPGKLGLGTAILGAMRYAMEHHYDYLISMDADFSHHPRYLPALLAGMSDRDVMIGSRYVPGGGTVNWPWSRRFISKSVNLLVRFLMGIPAKDTSGGYRCYRVSLLQQTPLDNLRSTGYSFQEEVLLRCFQAGARLGETPIIFEDRRAGSSKVNLWEMIRSLGTLLWLGITAFPGRCCRRKVSR